MRDLFEPAIARYRDCSPAIVRHYGNIGDSGSGVFVVPSPIDSAPMRVIASDGMGWDHVSVSRANRCPNWPELEHVKRLFSATTKQRCSCTYRRPITRHCTTTACTCGGRMTGARFRVLP